MHVSDQLTYGLLHIVAIDKICLQLNRSGRPVAFLQLRVNGEPSAIVAPNWIHYYYYYWWDEPHLIQWHANAAQCFKNSFQNWDNCILIDISSNRHVRSTIECKKKKRENGSRQIEGNIIRISAMKTFIGRRRARTHTHTRALFSIKKWFHFYRNRHTTLWALHN